MDSAIAVGDGATSAHPTSPATNASANAVNKPMRHFLAGITESNVAQHLAFAVEEEVVVVVG